MALFNLCLFGQETLLVGSNPQMHSAARRRPEVKGKGILSQPRQYQAVGLHPQASVDFLSLVSHLAELLSFLPEEVSSEA